MPVTDAAKNVIQQLNMSEISKKANGCLKKFLLVKTNEWINKEDKISYVILNRGPDQRYSYFGYVGWCGQLGFTLHAPRLNGIPLEHLTEIMSQVTAEEPC